MTTARKPSAGSPASVKRPRGEGQWALGYREPLNPNEQSKKDDDPLNVRGPHRRTSTPSRRLRQSIDKRRPARPDPLDGRSTPSASPATTARGPATRTPTSSRTKYFMLRVRSDGGALSTRLRCAPSASISTEFAPRHRRHHRPRRTSSTTGSEVEDVPEIWRRLAAVGLQTTEACGDCPRVVLGSPLAGESLDEVLDPSSGGRRDRPAATSDKPELLQPAAQVQDRDLGPAGRRPRGQRRRVHRRGPSLSTAPASTCGSAAACPPTRCSAQRVGAWVPLDEVPDVWEAVASVFRDYGYRRLRAKARLKFLIKDWGVEKFRQVLEDEYLKRKLIDGPAPSRSSTRSTTSASRSSRTARTRSASRRSRDG